MPGSIACRSVKDVRPLYVLNQTQRPFLCLSQAFCVSLSLSRSRSLPVPLLLRPGDESVPVTDQLDVSSVSVCSLSSSSPPLVPCGLASSVSATHLGGSSPPSSASSFLPIEMPSSSGRRLSADPLEPSPPSSHSSLPSTAPASLSASAPASAAASFVSVLLATCTDLGLQLSTR